MIQHSTSAVDEQDVEGDAGEAQERRIQAIDGLARKLTPAGQVDLLEYAAASVTDFVPMSPEELVAKGGGGTNKQVAVAGLLVEARGMNPEQLDKLVGVAQGITLGRTGKARTPRRRKKPAKMEYELEGGRWGISGEVEVPVVEAFCDWVDDLAMAPDIAVNLAMFMASRVDTENNSYVRTSIEQMRELIDGKAE